ncbi:MAG: C2H2-type zinc finger protein [Gammaproteobacteria bacterium]|nr:C2H2-type zinc finger protein [Gammaproteobacteria bacterium]
MDVKAFKCPNCNYRSTWKSSVKIHITAVHKGEEGNGGILGERHKHQERFRTVWEKCFGWSKRLARCGKWKSR